MGIAIFNPFSDISGKIMVVSPGRPPCEKKLSRTLRIFEEFELQYEISENVFAHGDNPKLPAPPELRAAEFNKALRRKDVSVILCARGGFGCHDILPLLDWDCMRRSKKIILGFSDITAIHMGMLKKNAGIPVAGPMISDLPASLGKNYPGLSLRKAISGDSKSLDISKCNKLKLIKRGSAGGFIVAGNLSVFCSMFGTEFMPSLRGAILLIEDINEPIHRIYRCLSHMKLSGILSEISGLLIGDFTNCGNRKDLNDVFYNFVSDISGPVLSGVKFGHIEKILSFRLGSRASILDGKLVLE